MTALGDAIRFAILAAYWALPEPVREQADWNTNERRRYREMREEIEMFINTGGYGWRGW